MASKDTDLTRVLNLATGESIFYSLDPRSAVVAAWEQSRGNYNTWTYGDSHAIVEHGQRTVTAGDFTAIKASA